MNAVPGQGPKASADRWGYRDWRFAALCGPTPRVAWAGISVTAICELPGEAWPQWWRSALSLIAELASCHPPLEPWLAQLQSRACLPAGLPPAAVAWQALEAACALPSYPLQLVSAGSEADQGQLQIVSACPYESFVVAGIQRIAIWLAWSHQAWRLGRLTLSRRAVLQWCAAFDRLPLLLPAPALLTLHQQLWQEGIAWQWLGGDQTRVGTGDRQRMVVGVAPDLNLSNSSTLQVPIYTVTGSVGKTTTARLLWQLLQPGCPCLALAASDGAWIGHRKISHGDCIGGRAARALLADPTVQAAVFEQGRGGLIKQGVPYRRSDVAILLNVQAVHLGREGVHSLAQMADVKAMGLHPARLVVLNLEDAQCCRIGAMRDPASCVWFAVEACGERLRSCSQSAHAALGVERDGSGEPSALMVWVRGQLVGRISLQGVAPYHGVLGSKTLEELLAAVAAAWVGPLTVKDWPARLSALRLDSSNHGFRTSLHRQGRVLFVLDKASAVASSQLLARSVEDLAQREGCSYRLLVLCRSAAESQSIHVEAARCLYTPFDAFVCFDRPDSYTSSWALPEYSPGDLLGLLAGVFDEMNASCGLAKPVDMLPDWQAVELHLRRMLPRLTGKVMVVINQPSTGSSELNQQITEFVDRDWPELAAESQPL